MWKDKNGEKKEHTEWHNIVLWRGLAELSEKYLHKGDRIYVEGRLRTRSWDDKDGNKRYTTDVIADNMTMLTVKREDEQILHDDSSADTAESAAPDTDSASGGLPF